MKYLLPCECGQSVEVEPGQAGQTVTCPCGKGLLVPSMLQVKALPVAPEKPVSQSRKTGTSYITAWVALLFGIVCLLISLPLWRFHEDIPFGGLLFLVCNGVGWTFAAISPAIALRTKYRQNDTNILSRSFFIIGVALLLPSFILAVYLNLWTPDPRHTTFKRTRFSYGSSQKMLPQNSTPIPYEEWMVLLMKDEYIDQMTPIELHSYFQSLESPTFGHNFRDNYEAVWATYRIWITVNVVLFILAFLSIVASFFMPKQNVVVMGWSGSEWQ